MKRFLSAAAVAASFFATPVLAETCGGTYVVGRGDSLSLIADKTYKNAAMWSLIHSNNIGSIGENPNSIRVGMKLRLNCIGGLPTGLEGGTEPVQVAAVAPRVQQPRQARRLEQKVNLVTAGDFAPFTDKSLEQDGLITEVVNAAMQASNDAEDFKIHWVNDWSAHLDPLMTNAMMDMAFPWYQPDCNGTPDHYRCQNFHFSEPMFEMLILLFVDKSRPITFSRDSDIEGRTLCRPAGYFTHDLDRADRRWISDEKITLKQPATVKECFDMLTAGTVDAVALNEFTGRANLKTLNLKDRVDVVQGRPVSIEGLHVLVHKEHPNAAELIGTINAGLGAIKDNGAYQQIIDRHLTTIWADF